MAIGENIQQTIIQQGFTPQQVIDLVRTIVKGEQPAPAKTTAPVSKDDNAHVFISYARVDGSDHAERLTSSLNEQGLKAWRDTRNLDPYKDMSGEIERAIEQASHVVVCVTPDVQREDSFVRREITFALEEKKPIIPLLFPDGRRPITIINHTYINFMDWDSGFAELLQRLEGGASEPTPVVTRRERELLYLQSVGQRYEHWHDLYTDMAATARIEKPKVRLKSAAIRYLEMEHDIFEKIDHAPDGDQGKIITAKSFKELREGIRSYQRVALIGDPGAGKTTTLERLAYELATAAVDDEQEPLPLFVRLGAYTGGGIDSFLEKTFAGLPLSEYQSGRRIFFLLDGLNEMPSERRPDVNVWLRANQETPVIVTCRKLDYVGLKLPLQRIDVVPLDVERVHLFISNYLEDEDRERLFWALAGLKTMQAWEWFQKNSEGSFFEFWFGEGEAPYTWHVEAYHIWSVQEALRNENNLPGMLGVVSNPFLLFVVIQIYTRQGEPPANRGQLFDQFITLLLKTRGETAAKTRPPWIEEQIQRKGLAALAYRMQAEKKGSSVNLPWVRAVLRETLPDQDADHLLYLAASASIIEQGKTVRFVHQLLQEYFAAYQMGEDLRKGFPASKYWPGEAWWMQTGWEETAVLLAGMLRNEQDEADATPVVRWLTPVQPALAYRCVTESGADCDPEAVQALYEPEEGARVAPLARMKWGLILAERGDTRKGVGLRPDGLPDFDWVKIAGGKFIYQDGEERDEGLFYMARYLVTFKHFQAFIADGGYENDVWWEGLAKRETKAGDQAFKFDNHPRENVSWYDAVAFCRWMTAKTKDKPALLPAGLSGGGWQISLPTEWQWEKAARGADEREYPWGNGYKSGYANVDEVERGVGPYYLRQTTAVGMYPQGASPDGVLDMSGNVWEWCLNEYSDPENINLAGNASRVLRGGWWSHTYDGARAAYRFAYTPDNRRHKWRVSGCGGCPCSSLI